MEMPWKEMYQIALCVLGMLIFCCLIRVIRGPRVADRIVGVNMLTTLVCIAICVLALLLGEGYLTDMALILCLLGFLAVVLLSKIYIGVWSKKQSEGTSSAEGGKL